MLIYAAVAVVLGLIFVAVPMITLAEIRLQYSREVRLPPAWGVVEVEGTAADMPEFSGSDAEIFGVSFVVALIAYLFVRSKLPEREHNWIGPFLY
jgi:hypothetical protein